MQGTRKGGYNNKISKFVVSSFKDDEDEDVVLDVDEALARKYAIALQSAWRSRTARLLVSALKQEANCKKHRNAHPELIEGGTVLSVTKCHKCLQGDPQAEVDEKVCHQRYHEVDHLLFSGQKRMTVNDSGDNWNQRFQRIVALPEASTNERFMKYSELYALNKDFVNTATSYAQTIISEYFLHVKDKSIVAKSMGGVAGGQKYLWRGILFKMADGSSGPYNGSDEAASKAAGHDLTGTTHYYSAGVKRLCLPLMALIDYKGFRMTAQAFLPLGQQSLVYGSADAGKTVLKSNPDFNEAMVEAAKKLNIRGHGVGGLGQQKELFSAVDIEGHVGMDGRFYLLDMSRSFPPEAPTAAKHLDDIFEDGSIVLVRTQDPENDSAFSYTKGTVNRAHANGTYYDVLFPDGSLAKRIPSSQLQSRKLSIFWRLLRPEYVVHRGSTLIPLQIEDIEPINSKAIITGTATSPSSSSVPTKEAMSQLHVDSNDGNAVVSLMNNPAQSPLTTAGATMAVSGDDAYDEFEDSAAKTSLPEVGYDDFDREVSPVLNEQAGDDTIDYDTFVSSPDISPTIVPAEVGRPSEQYDAFDMPGESASASMGHTAQQDMELSGVDQVSATAEYGYFDGIDDGLGDLPDSLPLKSTPSAIRMRRNSRFEAINFTDIVNYMQKYSPYNPSAVLELSEEDLKDVPMDAAYTPSPDVIKQRQAYIDSQVSEMYNDATTVVPFSVDEIQSRMRESRRLRFDSTPADPEEAREEERSHTSSTPRPCPLSPDALTAFSNFDPSAVDRNREVIRATERLVREVVPALAQSLANMPEKTVHSIDVSVFFHYHGVNIRHIGLVRSHIPASNKTSPIRTILLRQIVARTLKNICRDFQRRWMRSEQSSSDQGMFLLLTQYLNLIVGCHVNSEKFWEDRVTVGIIQRYGKCALDGNEEHMHRMRKEPQFLKSLVTAFLTMMNITLRPTVQGDFMKDKNPFGFEFVPEDIERLEPRVKYMHVIDYVSGVLMQERADVRAGTTGADPRTINRLRMMAGEHFLHAEKTLPSHRETCSRSDVIKELNEPAKKSMKDACVIS